MTDLRDDTLLRWRPEHELVRASDGRVLARQRANLPLFQILDGQFDGVASLLGAIDGRRTVAELCEKLAPQLGDTGRTFLEGIYDMGWIEIVPPASPAIELPNVEVYGDGVLAAEIAARLDGIAHVRRTATVFVAEGDATGAARVPPWSRGEDRPIADFTPRGALAICALENVAYRTIAQIEAKCAAARVPCLFVSAEDGRIAVGPLELPGSSIRFMSSRAGGVTDEAALSRMTAGSIDVSSPAHRRMLDRAIDRVRSTLLDQLAPDVPKPLLDGCLLISPNGERYARVVPSESESLELDIAIANHAAYSGVPDRPAAGFRSVGVVGGGTAGFLTALALRKKLPHLDVTVIQSPIIPVIGVGEATTARLVHFLHHELRLDAEEMYRAVQPTFKLGIRFEWGLPGDYYFNSPFQFGKLLESIVYDGDVNKNCLGSKLMSANRVPIIRDNNGGFRSMLTEVPYAYHLDNERFVAYLEKQALKAGCTIIDATVHEVVKSDESTVSHLVLDGDRKVGFDLFVDCSGFRSLLLDKAVGSPFLSYLKSLPTDSAIAANVPHGGHVKPYTVAETMEHGWCWNIPMLESDHRGYVFASTFASDEDAIKEMRAKNRGMSEHRIVRFRSGRHEHFWKGNVVGIGNSYAFVEPLQSTAIHMIIVGIERMIEWFPSTPSLRAFQPVLNKKVATVWDHLRDFLAVHYRFNHRIDSAFWRFCRENVEIGSLENYVKMYKERAPIDSRAASLPELDGSTFGVFRHDQLFMGHGMETTWIPPSESREDWRRISAAVDRIVDRALDQNEAFAVLVKHPEMLHRHIAQLAGARDFSGAPR